MSRQFATGTLSTSTGLTLPVSGSYTLAVWVYVAAVTSTTRVIWIRGTSPTRIYGISVFNSSGPKIDLAGKTYVYRPAVSLNTWTHAALVYDSIAHQCTSYINGASANVGSDNADGESSFDEIQFGGGPDVTLQDVMVFTSALSQSQIAETMRCSMPAGVGAFAWYRLTDADPTLDSSGNGHTLDSSGGANGSQMLMAWNGASAASGSMTPSVLIGGAGATSSAGGVSAGGTWPLSVSTGQTAASAAASVGVSRPLIASGATRAGAFTNISGGFVRPSIAKRSGFARRTATVLTGRRSVRR